jgi:hypothetical protein
MQGRHLRVRNHRHIQTRAGNFGRHRIEITAEIQQVPEPRYA